MRRCFNEECGWHLPLEDAAGREAAMARPLEDRLEAAMRHAGVSITVTSATNVIAFAIGHTSSECRSRSRSRSRSRERSALGLTVAAALTIHRCFEQSCRR